MLNWNGGNKIVYLCLAVSYTLISQYLDKLKSFLIYYVEINHSIGILGYIIKVYYLV